LYTNTYDIPQQALLFHMVHNTAHSEVSSLSIQN